MASPLSAGAVSFSGQRVAALWLQYEPAAQALHSEACKHPLASGFSQNAPGAHVHTPPRTVACTAHATGAATETVAVSPGTRESM